MLGIDDVGMHIQRRGDARVTELVVRDLDRHLKTLRRDE
jgi:hypothetical protein